VNAVSEQLLLFPNSLDHFLDTNLSEACSLWRSFLAPGKRFYVPKFSELLGNYNLSITDVVRKQASIKAKLTWKSDALARDHADALKGGQPVSYFKAVECILCLNALLEENKIRDGIRLGQVIAAVFYIRGFASYFQNTSDKAKQGLAKHLYDNRRHYNIRCTDENYEDLLKAMQSGHRVTFNTAFAVVKSIRCIDSSSPFAEGDSFFCADLPGKGLRMSAVPQAANCEEVIITEPSPENPYIWRQLRRP